MKAWLFYGMSFGVMYLYGIFIGALCVFLKAIKVIRVVHWERFPRWQKKLIVCPNHPSLVEAALLAALFFREYIFRPDRWAPWNTPDGRNFYDPLWFFWIRPRAIPVDRENRNGARALIRVKRVLNSGGRVILFGEGGRTHNGKRFLYSATGKHRIRELKKGIAWLTLRTKALIVPVWIEGTDKLWPKGKLFPRLRRITVKIGKPLKFEEQSKITQEDVIEQLSRALLELADEEE